VQAAERVELVADLAPETVDFVVLLGELCIARIHGLAARRGGLVLVLVDLRERLGGFLVVELEEPRGEERGRLVCAHADGRVKVVVENTPLNHFLQSCDGLLGNCRNGLGDVLKVQVLLEQRVLGTRARSRLTHKGPVLGTDGLLLQLGNLHSQLALPPLVCRESWGVSTG
jgi:hypothetical protein